jgi:ribosomal protein L32
VRIKKFLGLRYNNPMLIKCTECGKEISDHAVACPNCGNPTKKTDQENPPKLRVQPELTSKKWKKVKIIGWIVFFVGLMIMGVGEYDWNNPTFGLGLLVTFGATTALIVAKIGAWYADQRTR